MLAHKNNKKKPSKIYQKWKIEKTNHRIVVNKFVTVFANDEELSFLIHTYNHTNYAFMYIYNFANSLLAPLPTALCRFGLVLNVLPALRKLWKETSRTFFNETFDCNKIKWKLRYPLGKYSCEKAEIDIGVAKGQKLWTLPTARS